MTDSNRSNGSEIAALLEERRKFDAWLAALEARRESTPEHVFERVRADYESRMRDVEERLSAHRHSIQQERSSLQSRRSLLEAEEQLRRDERAELELRAHVGELTESDSDSAFKAVDEALGQMKTERESLDARITELSALLDTKAPEPEKKEEVPPAPAPVVDETPLVEEKSVEVAKADEPIADLPVAETPTAESPKIEKSGRGMHTPGGTFDELAFLSNVVGQKKEPPPLLQDMTAGEAPLASNVPANTPIKLRTSGAMEQSKTLKCTECGALNYPTEWYCERCGAELAAL